MLVRLLVEVGHVLAGMILMLLQVVVRAVRNAPELAPAEREEELDIGRRLGVEGKLLLLMIAQAQILDVYKRQELGRPFAARSHSTACVSSFTTIKTGKRPKRSYGI